MLSTLVAIASFPTDPMTLHLILAANRGGGQRPIINSNLWPKHVRFNLKMVPDTLGSCTAEAVSYLRGVVQVYDSIKPTDIVVFMHAHDTSWHTPVPMQQQILRLLGLDYMYDEPFGAMYCFDNDRWAASSLVNNNNIPVPKLWSYMFANTAWEAETPDIRSMQYPCCATFFAQGEVILRHAVNDYNRVEQNLIANCKRERELFPPNYPTPMARLMEGSWHLMLANVTRIPPPPYCPSKLGHWTNSLRNRHHLQQRLEHPGLAGGNRTNRTAVREHRAGENRAGENWLDKPALVNGLQKLKHTADQLLGMLETRGRPPLMSAAAR